ncbi:ABC transporter ATP-binding protein [Pelagibius marinus]|uniref:ABC transporter ATP-binding protein n=1 Tax=Pelagibius marinus TaxID=2762760 RepID=UPI001D03FA2F|nr:ABC transporter ATP-binding protein [Pelagibius marinus]
MLKARDVTVRFGGVVAVGGMSIDVHAGEIVGLIGPNGAGKTTFINAVSGTYVPTQGTISWRDEDIVGHSPSRLARIGVGRTFQNVASLNDLTVLDVVKVGRSVHGHSRGLREFLCGSRADDEALTERLLEPLGLADHRHSPLQMLSYGHRKAVDIARALASEPDLLLLDEPVAGVAPAEAFALAGFVKQVRDLLGCAVVMVEHKMDVVMSTCDRVVVMAEGCKIFDGSGEAAQSDAEVRRVYLGD